MSKKPSQYDTIIYHEMMSHPALFTHESPKTVALICHHNPDLLLEILKHTHLDKIMYVGNKEIDLSISDARVHWHFQGISEWLTKSSPQSVDILIVADEMKEDHFNQYFNQLNDEGILVQQCSSVFELDSIKSAEKKLLAAGFQDTQLFHFPQPNFPSGWRSAIMSSKKGTFKRVREMDIYNKPFQTSYYNHDMHKASLAIPEFLREKI